MSWMNQVGGLLSKYAGGTQGGDAANDFDQVAQHAPQDLLTGGIASALKSDQTPPIGQIVSQVFGQASGDQKAGILNAIISAVGPAVIAQVLGQVGLGNLAGMLGGSVTPQQAEQVPPEAAGQMAERAQQENPNVVDQLSGFLSGNPGLMKSLGGGALSAVMSRLGK